MVKKVLSGLSFLPLLAAGAFAQTAYFEMPATFSADAKATVIAVIGTILAVLAVMWAIRKTIKTVNRS